jgi:hypothetical protein
MRRRSAIRRCLSCSATSCSNDRARRTMRRGGEARRGRRWAVGGGGLVCVWMLLLCSLLSWSSRAQLVSRAECDPPACCLLLARCWLLAERDRDRRCRSQPLTWERRATLCRQTNGGGGHHRHATIVVGMLPSCPPRPPSSCLLLSPSTSSGGALGSSAPSPPFAGDRADSSREDRRQTT